MDELVAGWLAEDVGRGDRTTEAVIDERVSGVAQIEAREALVVAGLDWARACFDAAGGGIDWIPKAADGEQVAAEEVVVRVAGRLRTILTGERTALNLLARLCGIASMTSEYVAAIRGTPARITDTRKTTPGLRALEKYAVRMGGGSNHRFGLDDGVLIKDNHIMGAGGITPAVGAARQRVPHSLLIEVEVADLDGLDEALAAGADAVLLDNMTPNLVAEAVTRAGGKVLLEASGGITLATVRAYAEAGVDLISIGALTQRARASDLALEVISRGA
jgi:nicotinate-nucleotide pyrophosphorylase (carboxylating)